MKGKYARECFWPKYLELHFQLLECLQSLPLTNLAPKSQCQTIWLQNCGYRSSYCCGCRPVLVSYWFLDLSYGFQKYIYVYITKKDMSLKKILLSFMNMLLFNFQNRIDMHKGYTYIISILLLWKKLIRIQPSFPK